VATQLRKLMAYKDEYEVARLYTDGEFEKRIAEEFEGQGLRLEFYMAPPAFLKPRGGRAAAPKKVRFGPWLFPLLKILARGKGLRGTVFDPFGRTEERRLERDLIAEYEARVEELCAGLGADKLVVATAIANVPASIRGYGHVKLASLAIARARERELLNRFDPDRYPRPSGPAVAGQFRGIPVTSA
jgi:indolepyruvate ferredoxin oxidoreductase